jgi:hypothetical protein
MSLSVLPIAKMRLCTATGALSLPSISSSPLHSGRTRAQADDDHLHPLLIDYVRFWFLNSRNL